MPALKLASVPVAHLQLEESVLVGCKNFRCFDGGAHRISGGYQWRCWQPPIGQSYKSIDRPLYLGSDNLARFDDRHKVHGAELLLLHCFLHSSSRFSRVLSHCVDAAPTEGETLLRA